MPRLVLALALAAACTSERARPEGEACLTWRADVEPLFAARCAACHAEASPAAGYVLTDYAGVLGDGRDQAPNAIAGEPTSSLVTVLDPATADATHRPFVDLHELVRAWVVDCRLAYRDSDLHEGGLMNPADPAFHGAL